MFFGDAGAASRLCEPIACVPASDGLCIGCLEVESDDYCATVIGARQKDGFFEPSPLFRDVATFTPSGDLALAAEGLTGGFPCQAGAWPVPFSSLARECPGQEPVEA